VFRNYLVTALRNIARHKLYSFINIAGLAVGLACVIFIMLFIRDELSFDKWVPGSDNLYRVDMAPQLIPGNPFGHVATAPFPLPAFMKDNLPEVTAMTRLWPTVLMFAGVDEDDARSFTLVVLTAVPSERHRSVEPVAVRPAK